MTINYISIRWSWFAHFEISRMWIWAGNGIVDWSGNPDICFRPLLSVFPMRNLFLINIFWEQIICSRVWLNLTRLVAHFFQSQSHFPILCQKSETFLKFWIWNRKESYAWKNYCQSLSWSSYKTQKIKTLPFPVCKGSGGLTNPVAGEEPEKLPFIQNAIIPGEGTFENTLDIKREKSNESSPRLGSPDIFIYFLSLSSPFPLTSRHSWTDKKLYIFSF